MDKNYYNVGSLEELVVSNSFMKIINPEEGGHPKKAKYFFRDKSEETDSQALNNGKLLHSYVEKPNDFVIEEENLPSDMMQGLIDTIRLFKHDEYLQDEYHLMHEMDGKKSSMIAEFAKLYGFVDADLGTLAYKAFLYARNKTLAYKVKKDETVLADLCLDANVAYFTYKEENEGKIMLKAKDAETIKACVNSLTFHPKISEILNLGGNTSLSDLNTKVYKELPIYWQRKVKVLGSIDECRINMKALLDHLRIDFKNKTITYIDLKSTKGDIATFNKTVNFYRYYRQIAVYRFAIIAWFKETFPDYDIKDFKFKAYLIPVETSFPYACTVYNVTADWMKKGREEVESLLSRIAWHKVHKQWEYTYEEIAYDHIIPLPFIED